MVKARLTPTSGHELRRDRTRRLPAGIAGRLASSAGQSRPYTEEFGGKAPFPAPWHSARLETVQRIARMDRASHRLRQIAAVAGRVPCALLAAALLAATPASPAA